MQLFKNATSCYGDVYMGKIEGQENAQSHI